eukprot:1145718-Pelagomonas_calceolata.AAC.1
MRHNAIHCRCHCTITAIAQSQPSHSPSHHTVAVNYTPMHAAAEAGQVCMKLQVIEAGAFVDKQVARAINEALGIRIRNGGQRTGVRDDHMVARQLMLMLSRHHCLCCAGVRSFASSAAQNQLVDSRDSSMLPNGGGRLSDLKDVTGKSIWQEHLVSGTEVVAAKSI